MREFLNYGTDSLRKQQALFANFFVVQNRLQTAGEKVQTEISMRQWHLLAMMKACEGNKTLTDVGRLMGCSRQNVKNLAVALNKKGFVEFVYGANNSVMLEMTEKATAYLSSMTERHCEVLSRLFSSFSEKEIDMLFELNYKLLGGLEQVEKYADGCKGDNA